MRNPHSKSADKSRAQCKRRQFNNPATILQQLVGNLQEAETTETVNRNPDGKVLKCVLPVICKTASWGRQGTRYSLELLHEGAMVSYVLPKAFKDGADVVANGELVVELAGGSSMLNI